MGIFNKIKDAIFGHHAQAETPVTGTATIAPGSVNPTVASAAPAPVTPAAPAPSTSAAAPSASGTSAPAQNVDVAAILDKAVADKGQKLDWRHSIVDLMKALGMDASLAERKELAEELHYTGDAGDSAKMNTFLHKALLKKLSENGGKVPADLMD